MRTHPDFARWIAYSTFFLVMVFCLPQSLRAGRFENFPTEDYLKKLQAFCEAHPDDPSAILGEEDLSIQLAAYWRYVNHVPTDQKIFNIHALMHARKKFIGVLTSRLGESPPQWWKDSLVKESLSFTKSIEKHFLHHNFKMKNGAYVPRIEDVDEFAKYARCGDAILDPDIVVVESSDSLIFVHAGSKQLLKTEAQKEVLYYEMPLGITILQEGSVFTCYGQEFGEEVRIYYVSQEGNLRWKTELWGNGDRVQPRPIGRSPQSTWFRHIEKYPQHHYHEVTEHNDLITVYGADFSGAYIEQYDLITGKSRFRFSTVYSDPAYIEEIEKNAP